MSFQKKPANALEIKINSTKRKIRFLKIKLFLLITLPIAIVTIGQAVIKEYIRARVKQAAASAGHHEEKMPAHKNTANKGDEN